MVPPVRQEEAHLVEDHLEEGDRLPEVVEVQEVLRGGVVEVLQDVGVQEEAVEEVARQQW